MKGIFSVLFLALLCSKLTATIDDNTTSKSMAAVEDSEKSIEGTKSAPKKIYFKDAQGGGYSPYVRCDVCKSNIFPSSENGFLEHLYNEHRDMNPTFVSSSGNFSRWTVKYSIER